MRCASLARHPREGRPLPSVGDPVLAVVAVLGGCPTVGQRGSAVPLGSGCTRRRRDRRERLRGHAQPARGPGRRPRGRPARCPGRFRRGPARRRQRPGRTVRCRGPARRWSVAQRLPRTNPSSPEHRHDQRRSEAQNGCMLSAVSIQPSLRLAWWKRARELIRAGIAGTAHAGAASTRRWLRPGRHPRGARTSRVARRRCRCSRRESSQRALR